MLETYVNPPFSFCTMNLQFQFQSLIFHFNLLFCYLYFKIAKDNTEVNANYNLYTIKYGGISIQNGLDDCQKSDKNLTFTYVHWTTATTERQIRIVSPSTLPVFLKCSAMTMSFRLPLLLCHVGKWHWTLDWPSLKCKLSTAKGLPDEVKVIYRGASFIS